MKRGDFLKILKERGVVFYAHGSNHIHKDTGKKIPIPRHSEIKNSTVAGILKEIPK
jgi:predicted RNA binding protein YcfA (HicA-like mRNA interferase family)